MTNAIDTLINNHPDLAVCQESLIQALELLSATYRGGGKLLLCGNGGSGADCEHIVGELMKGFLSPRPLPQEVRKQFRQHFPEEADYLADHLQGALPAISLVSHPALSSAFGNDVSAEMVFAQQVYGYGRPHDALWAISTSGNSANVVRAVQVARAVGMATIGLTGRDGGKLTTLCDVVIKAPRDLTHEVQEMHLPMYHALCISLEHEFFDNRRN